MLRYAARWGGEAEAAKFKRDPPSHTHCTRRLSWGTHTTILEWPLSIALVYTSLLNQPPLHCGKADFWKPLQLQWTRALLTQRHNTAVAVLSIIAVHVTSHLLWQNGGHQRCTGSVAWRLRLRLPEVPALISNKLFVTVHLC